jgi:hypothetical protein
MSMWSPTWKRKLGQRCWLQDHDGTYYRTYALIQAELDQAMARGRARLADDLIAEGLRVLEEGPLRKDELGPGDVLSDQAQVEAEPAEPSSPPRAERPWPAGL